MKGGFMAFKDKAKMTEYQNKYIKEKFDRINLTVEKGKKETIKAHAIKYDGGSVNAFINRAIAETMERDQTSALKKD